MRSAFPRGAAAALLLLAGSGGVAAERALRVCADPNNLPFSNSNEEGFENRIAEMIAQELGVSLSYSWWPQRRGFLRNTLKADDARRTPRGFGPPGQRAGRRRAARATLEHVGH